MGKRASIISLIAAVCMCAPLAVYADFTIIGGQFKRQNQGEVTFDTDADGGADFIFGGNRHLGIGTLNPTGNLHVIGNIIMEDGNQSAGYVLSSDANGLSTWTDLATLNGVWTIDSGNIYRASGFVGIGNSMPAAMLQTDISAAGTKGQIIKAAASQTANLMEWQDSSGTVLGVIDQNGNVGVGASSAGNRLEVSDGTILVDNSNLGDVDSDHFITKHDNNNEALKFTSKFAATNHYYNQISSAASVDIGGTRAISLKFDARVGQDTASNSTTNAVVMINAHKNSAAFALSTLFAVYNNDVEEFAVLPESLRITGGNIISNQAMSLGVGTAAPSANLHLQGNLIIDDGNQSANYVLASDANGLGQWTDVTTLPGQWAFESGNYYIASGNVGIGTSAPANQFNLHEESAFVRMRVTGNAYSSLFMQDLGSTNNRQIMDIRLDNDVTSFIPHNNALGSNGVTMTINHDPNTKTVTVGKASENARLILDGGDGSEKSLQIQEGSTTVWFMGMDNSPTTDDLQNAFVIKTANDGSPNFMLDAGGNVAIGTSMTNNAILTVAGNIMPSGNNSYDLGSASAAFRSTYSIDYVMISDKRHKQNVKLLKSGLGEVMKLEPVSYEFKSQPDVPRMGFIAQDLEKVMDKAVHKGGDVDQTLGVRYNDMIPVLVKAIQEQQAQIEELKRYIRDNPRGATPPK